MGAARGAARLGAGGARVSGAAVGVAGRGAARASRRPGPLGRPVVARAGRADARRGAALPTAAPLRTRARRPPADRVGCLLSALRGGGPATGHLGAHWTGRLATGAQIQVPEPYVEHALRAVLVQNLELTWRYSVGNPYQEFSFPESVDGAEVLAEYGFASVARSMLRTSFTRAPN